MSQLSTPGINSLGHGIWFFLYIIGYNLLIFYWFFFTYAHENTGVQFSFLMMSLTALGASLVGSDSKESAGNVGDLGSISSPGRCPGEGNGYPLQYSCLKNSMYRGAWWASAMGFQRVRQDCATNTMFPWREAESSSQSILDS